jgi:valyl-tRNA synthetase
VAGVDRALADYAFGEVTRLLYDAIWTEYCDWGIELAKVTLADESVPTKTREATWWTLVEALDTYLRLLHPVMPFVTEALWAALPHADGDPALLIVADWPTAGERDEGVERTVGATLDLVRAIRNARAEAGVEASIWLAVDLAAPGEFGDVVDSLRPAIGRLARARPLAIHAGHEALGASGATGLSVVAGPFEAIVARPGDAAEARERERLERELSEAEGFLEATRARLANDAFTSRAPAHVVDGARVREAELADQVARLRARLGR